MNIGILSWRYLWARPLTTVLNVLLLAVGLAALGTVWLAQSRVTAALTRDVGGVDLVVGAKGSPMQLILAGIYHLDVPPGNIALADAREALASEQVAEWLPLSLGDTLAGHRIVGTTPAYLDWFGGALAQGRVWAAPLEAVLGAEVAQAQGLKVGDHFVGAHGLGAGGHVHDGQPYTVVGVLQGTGAALDRLVLTATESVWQVHEADMAVDDDDRAALAAEREITLALVRYRTPLAAVTFPRWINAATSMQAAAPAYELSRLLSMLGVGTATLQVLAATLVGMAGLSVFMALWQAVRERQPDLALLRMLGAPAPRLAWLLLAESAWLALLGCVVALVLAALGWEAVRLSLGQAELGGWVLSGWHVAALWQACWPLPLLAACVAVVAALLPAWGAYRTDVDTLLAAAR